MSKISRELVFRLADEISLENNPVTNIEIRKRNGFHGSLSTISPLLKEWKDTQRQRQLESESLPKDILIKALEPAWALLKNEARKELENTVNFYNKEDDRLMEDILTLAHEFDKSEGVVRFLNGENERNRKEAEGVKEELEIANVLLKEEQ